jgi:hypothetical protein
MRYKHLLLAFLALVPFLADAEALQTTLDATVYQVNSGTATGTNCPSFTTISTNGFRIQKDASGSSTFQCNAVSPLFQTSHLPTNAQFTNAEILINFTTVNNGINCNITHMSHLPTVYQTLSNTLGLFNDINNGTAYVSNNSFCATTGSKTVSLGGTAISDISGKTATASPIAFGITYTNFTRDGSQHNADFTSSSLKLRMTYNTPPNPPKLVGATLDEILGRVTLTWTCGTANGGTGNSVLVQKFNGISWQNMDTLLCSSSTTWTDTTPLNPHTKYRLRSYDSIGTGLGYTFAVNSTLTTNIRTHLHYDHTFTDHGQEANTITTTGKQLFSSGINGGTRYFDGTSYDSLNNESDYDFEHSNGFSMSMWAKPITGIAAFDILAGKGNNCCTTGGEGYYLQYLTSSQSVRFSLVDSSGTEYQANSNTSSVLLNEWTHIFVTFSGNSNQNGIKIYINGAVASTPTSLAISNTILNNVNLTIGAESDGGRIFNGYIDDFRIYNKEMSASEVLDIYNERVFTISDTAIITPQRPADSDRLTQLAAWFDSLGGVYMGMSLFPFLVMMIGFLAGPKTTHIFVIITLSFMGIIHASGYFVYPEWFWIFSLFFGMVVVLSRK